MRRRKNSIPCKEKTFRKNFLLDTEHLESNTPSFPQPVCHYSMVGRLGHTARSLIKWSYHVRQRPHENHVSLIFSCFIFSSFSMMRLKKNYLYFSCGVVDNGNRSSFSRLPCRLTVLADGASPFACRPIGIARSGLTADECKSFLTLQDSAKFRISG